MCRRILKHWNLRDIHGYPGYPIDAANAYSDFQTLSTYMEKQTLSTFMENQKYIQSNPKYSGQDIAISRI